MVNDVEVEVLTSRRSKLLQKIPLRLETSKTLLCSPEIIQQVIPCNGTSKRHVKVNSHLNETTTKTSTNVPKTSPTPVVVTKTEEKTEIKPKTERPLRDVYGDVNNRPSNDFEELSWSMAATVYLAWAILVMSAYFRDFLVKMGLDKDRGTKETEKQRDFVPIYRDFDAMYVRNMYMRIKDVFERPICDVPGATVELLDRVSHDYNWTFQFTGTRTRAINVSSYNYLGFAQSSGPCAEASIQSIVDNGLVQPSTAAEFGTPRIVKQLETLVAEFLEVEDAMVFSMGFATNSMNIASLADKHTLIVSDQRNHSSLIVGCRQSGATIKVFKHNDMKGLDELLLTAVLNGNPKTGQEYRKILIVVEGIYSMDGSICPLREIIALKKKYKAYLYLDEAHSIGAMGRTGRGVVEYWNCEFDDVDILMGTFTKSFGSAGGYIAGKRNIIEHIRKNSGASFYSVPMSFPVAQQIVTSMSIIMGKDGTKDGAIRLERLARNTRYLRMRLKQEGFVCYGSDDSPVIPVLLYYPAKVGYYGREMLRRGVAAVVVSYPATEMTVARVRLCISAAHTKEQLDYVLKTICDVSDIANIRYSKHRHLYKHLNIQW